MLPLFLEKGLERIVEKLPFQEAFSQKRSNQGSHLDWKTWENGKAFFSQGKVRKF